MHPGFCARFLNRALPYKKLSDCYELVEILLINFGNNLKESRIFIENN